MTAHFKAIPLILAGVLLNAFAQIAMKKAVSITGMEWQLGALVRLFLHPWMLVCLACYGVSVVLWAAAMNLVSVNFAYPFLALGFVAGALMARFFLQESIPGSRWLAISVIVLGVGLQALTAFSENEKSPTSSTHGRHNEKR